MIEKQHQTYHYLESGLPNVYLQGITVYECPVCDEVMPEIPSLRKLHLAIAMELVGKPDALSGTELRYLRKEMGVQAKTFAKMLGYTPQHLSRIENGHEGISEQADKLTRSLFLMRRIEEASLRNQLDEIKNQLDQIFASFRDRLRKHSDRRISINMPAFMISEKEENSLFST